MKLFSLISPSANIDALSQLCQPEDAILLRQDAVYLCLRDDISWPTAVIYALDSDLAVRQLQATDNIKVINVGQWVELCADAGQNLLWQN